MSLMNAYQKLDTAVRVMVGKDAPLLERVKDAVAEVQQIVIENDMPPVLRPEFTQLLEMIRSFQKDKKPEWTAAQIAVAILVIFKRLLAETGFSN
ncbi:MAG TPA: hypothetical protein VN376_03205 [Longilinea sp.]|nr:hypothetical protein [Longilinea sp.]